MAVHDFVIFFIMTS